MSNIISSLIEFNYSRLVKVNKPSIFLSTFHSGGKTNLDACIHNDLPELVDVNAVCIYALLDKTDNDRVIGVSVIRRNAIGDKRLSTSDKGITEKSSIVIPCLELMMLAADKNYSGCYSKDKPKQKYGELILSYTLMQMRLISNSVGASFILLKAADDGSGKLLDYYRKFGFQDISDHMNLLKEDFGEGCYPMILDFLEHGKSLDAEIFRKKVDFFGDKPKPQFKPASGYASPTP